MFAPFRLRALLAGIDLSASGSETGVEQGRCCAVIGGMGAHHAAVDRWGVRRGRVPQVLIAVKPAMNDWSDEETEEPLIADRRNFYKVEKWTKDGSKVDHMLYAGSSLDKAREVFAEAIYHRPRIRLTIRQRTLVLEQWPKPEVGAT